MAEVGATMNDDGSWWVPMPSGVRFYPENPEVDKICIYDIATKLAQQCRYGGGTVEFYSVAEHCVHLSRIEPTLTELGTMPIWNEEEGTSPYHARVRFQREALLHDRAEWALQDFIRPLKRKCKNWYLPLERRLEEVSAIPFGVMPTPPALVMHYDNRICKDEKMQALHLTESSASSFDDVTPLYIQLEFWDPKEARDQFLKRFFELFPQANEKGWVI